jgi:hypothetical protein
VDELSERARGAWSSVPGRRIVELSWAGVALYTAVGVPFALGFDAVEGAAVAVSFGEFLVSLPVWVYAFLRAVVRTGTGDDITVASLFFLSGSAPARVRRHLLGAVVVCVVVVAATAAPNPAAVLVPMLPMGMAGLWGARHGVYPPRRG